MERYYNCSICNRLIKKDNLLGNYENYTCDECWEKYCVSKKGDDKNRTLARNSRKTKDVR